MKYNIKLSVVKCSVSVEVPNEISPVADLLMAEIRKGDVNPWLQLIDDVLSGKSSYREGTGNACTIEVQKEFSKVINNFALTSEDEECLIETVELRNIIVYFQENRDPYYAEAAKHKD